MNWQCDFLKSGLYCDLQQWFPALASQRDFPNLDTLASWLAPDTVTEQGQAIGFCAEPPGDYYELQVMQTGRVPTREQNWHDMFNAFAWALFPQAKARINALHVADIAAFGLHPRTLRRDSLTLFDECGVLVPSSDKSLLEALRQHHWREVFFTQRGRWGRDIEARVFGHAVYEQGLTPYLGLTAKMFPIEVAPAYFSLSLKERYRFLDATLAAMLAKGALDNKKRLSPLPLLGVPGWWPGNTDSAFFDNPQYFRPLFKPRAPL